MQLSGKSLTLISIVIVLRRRDTARASVRGGKVFRLLAARQLLLRPLCALSLV